MSAFFKRLFNREKSTQDEKVCFIKGNELKVTQIELFSFFIFENVFVCLLFSSIPCFNTLPGRGVPSGYCVGLRTGVPGLIPEAIKNLPSADSVRCM